MTKHVSRWFLAKRSVRRAVAGWLAAMVVGVAGVSEGSTVVVYGGFGFPPANGADGGALDPGFKVSVGLFAEGFDPSAASADIGQLLANWIEYGATETAVIDGVPGSFYLKEINNDAVFAGKRIYLFLTRTNDGGAPVAGNVTDYGVFSSGDEAWIFPPIGGDVLPPGDLTTIHSGQIDQALWGAAGGGSVDLAYVTGGGTGPSAWDEWVAAVLGDGWDEALAAALADPAGVVGSRGLKNVVHFALDSNPLDGSAPPYETVVDGEGRIGIRYTRKKSAISGYTATASASANLVDWGLTVEELIVGETGETEDVEAYPVFPQGEDAAKAFFRITVQPVEGGQ
jgi:hypothetical protein